MVCRRNKWFGHKCKGEKLLQKLCSRHQRPRLTRLDLRKLIWCKTQSVIWPCLSLNLMDRGWETGARSLDDVEITVESSQNAGVESDPILNDEVEAREVAAVWCSFFGFLLSLLPSVVDLHGMVVSVGRRLWYAMFAWM
ncbi:hypothetical protein QQ045_015484 [Rhodiola kirilowii]